MPSLVNGLSIGPRRCLGVASTVPDSIAANRRASTPGWDFFCARVFDKTGKH